LNKFKCFQLQTTNSEKIQPNQDNFKLVSDNIVNAENAFFSFLARMQA